MPGHNETKVSRGEPVSIPAGLWNTLIDVARAFRRNNGQIDTGSNVPADEAGNLKLSIQNDTSTATLKVYSVLKIYTPLEAVDIDILNNSTDSFSGIVPAANTDTIVITQADIDKDTIGPAVYQGITPVQLLVNDSTHTYARPVAGQTGYLESATSGPALILWKNGTSGTVDSIVNLIGVTSSTSGGGGGGGGTSSGTCACGWIAGVKEGDCFSLSIEFPSGTVSPLALYWTGDSDSGHAIPAIDPATSQPYKFTICGVACDVELTKNDDGEPSLIISKSTGSGTETHILSLDCCITNGAYFTGNGVPDCFS